MEEELVLERLDDVFKVIRLIMDGIRFYFKYIDVEFYVFDDYIILFWWVFFLLCYNYFF